MVLSALAASRGVIELYLQRVKTRGVSRKLAKMSVDHWIGGDSYEQLTFVNNSVNNGGKVGLRR